MANRVNFSVPSWTRLALPADVIRERMAALESSWTGASTSRRSMVEWGVSAGDADTDTLGDLPNLRERSRDLTRNNPLARGAVNTNVTNVIGTGLHLRAQINAEMLGLTEEQAQAWQARAEMEFRLFADALTFDTGRRLNFSAMQDLAFRSMLENGDVFATRSYKKRPGAVYGTHWQLIEADRVCNERREMDTPVLAGGIERNRKTTEALRYHIRVAHPGSILDFEERWVKINAYDKSGRPNVLHVLPMIRVGQTRGIPYLAPVIESFKQLGRYTESELMAAVVSSFLTVFVKSEGGQANLDSMLADGLTGTAPNDPSGDIRLGSGAVVGLAPNESIETVDPSRPNPAFDPFILAILRQIGTALELPFEVLVKHFTASYSAARAALLEAWKYFMTRRVWFARAFCQPIYELFLEEAIAMGRLSAPGFFRDPIIRQAYSQALWIGPAQGQIDPTKETEAAKMRMELGLTTHAEETAALTGTDWDSKLSQIAYEQKVMREIGLAPVQPTPGSQPQEQDNEVPPNESD